MFIQTLSNRVFNFQKLEIKLTLCCLQANSRVWKQKESVVQAHGLFCSLGSRLHFNLTKPLLSGMSLLVSGHWAQSHGSVESPEGKRPRALTDRETGAAGAPGIPMACPWDTLHPWSLVLSGIPRGHWTALEGRKQKRRGEGCGRKPAFAPSQQQRLFTSKSVFFKEVETSRGKTPF